MSGVRFGHISRKRKAELKLRVAKARKARNRQAQSERPQDNLTLTTSVDDSLHVSGAREDDKELEAVFEEEEESTRNVTVDYKQWINSLQREHQQMLAMMLYDNYRERFGLQKTSAAEEVALCLGVSDKTIRLWRKDFLNNSGQFSPDKRGKYPRHKPLVQNDKS